MTSSCVSSHRRAGLFVLSVLSVASLLAATALAQTASGKSGGESEKYLNNSLYRIAIQDNYLTFYYATGILIKGPNLILTTPVRVDSTNVYDKDERPFNRFWVCEQALDIVQAEAKRKQIAEEEKQTKYEENRYAEIKKANEQKSAKGGHDKASAKKEDVEKAKQEALDLKVDCVEATVKMLDSRRGFVLLQAMEKLEGGVPNFNASDPLVNSTVRTFGFPGAYEGFNPRRATEKERSRLRFVPTITTGTVVKINTDEKEGQRFVHQAPVSSGAWGSPLVNNCDEVVGLNFVGRAERVVKVEGTGKVIAKQTGQVEVGTALVPTSNLTGAIGTKELLTFAALNGIELQNVSYTPCSATLASQFSLQQPNTWTLFVGAAALLVASAAVVLALRRPGPVRNTITKMFPGRARSRFSTSTQRQYADSYSAPDYSSDAAPTDAYAAKRAPAALRADPTALMPAYAGASARLVPIAGGQTFALDPARLAGSGLTFGRESECDVVSDNSTVSKRHARITRTHDGKLQVEDLGSANGTWRGRSRIQREAFSNGEIVRFGAIEYRVELSGEGGASSTLLMPSVSWQLSGLDEDGHPVHWQLQPTIDGSGRQVETSWIVGRDSERADLVLSDKRVSSQHAKLRFTPQRGLEICDLASSNGTKVDGRKITDSFIVIDDAHGIEFGGSKMSMSKS